jgi:deoxyadenosine/deoxycytidine kinase
MIVEFIGSTGAGKTTLIREVHRRLAKTTSVTTSVDLATSLLGMQGVVNPTLQNLIQEIVSFPFFIGTFYRNSEFLRHTVKLFWRNSRLSITAINNLRSLERKIGIYEISSRIAKDRIILVDEGPILAAHMLAFTGAAYTLEEISKFTNLLPLPDRVVYVRAPLDTLLTRTAQRADPPREIDQQNPAQMQAFVRNAVAIFDQLIEFESIRSRLLIVDSPDAAQNAYEQVVDDVCSFILSHAPLANRVN